MKNINEYEESLNQLYIVSKFSFSVINKDGETVLCRPERETHFLPQSLMLFFINDYSKKNNKKNTPYIYITDEGIYIGMLMLPNGNYIVIGPSLSHPVNLSILADKYSKYFITEEISKLNEICMNCSKTDGIIFANLLSCVYEIFYHKHFSVNDILNIYPNNESVNTNANYSQHIDYDNLLYTIDAFNEYENKMASAIEAGNNSSLEEVLQHPVPIVLNNLKTDINTSLHIIIPFLTVFRRAALSGGADTTAVFKLYDNIIKRIIENKTYDDCYKIISESSTQFCSLVSSARAYGPYAIAAAKCEKYINSHISEHITIKELSLVCGVSERQICRIFSECFNTSVNKYINSERIRIAKIMLSSSNYKIIEISNQLGYTSQSHFTRNFIKLTGCTPKEYRIKFNSSSDN